MLVINNWFSAWSRADVLAAVAILVSALLTVITIIVGLWGWTLRAWLTERRLVAEFGSDLYLPEQIENATRYYVRPSATSIDLAQEIEEGSNVIGTREDLFKAVERFLDKESKHRHMLLLADSGMGKSSFVLNYYDYNRRKWFKRYKLAVIPLGNKKAIEKIREIKKPNETVLFLDALDEDPAVRDGYERRLAELMEACADFRRVLITCRTQFFSREAAIPKVASLVFAPRSGQAQYTFWHWYIAPFSDEQVDTFLKRRFWFWSFEKKRKARELAMKAPKLTVRPMLLAHIPDLLQTDRALTTAWDVYEVMTEKWYERELGFWKRVEDLKGFSEEMAVHSYRTFLLQGIDRVPRDDIRKIIIDLMFAVGDIDEWNATARSLLHRDAEGNWKFAHYSIMEFLFLKRFFAGDGRCRGIDWTEQMKNFIVERDSSRNCPLFLSLGPLDGGDLKGVDLRGASLRQANLREVNLSGADLGSADLHKADLSGARLMGTKLTSAQLIGANLSGVNLRDAYISGANLSLTDLSGMDLNGIDLSETRLVNAKLRETNFTGALMSGADLSHADLTGAELNQAILDGANLSGANLNGTDFSMANLHKADMRGTSPKLAYLSGANLAGTDLSSADFTGKHLKGVNFSGADLRAAVFHQAVLSGVIFSQANLSVTDFTLADLTGVVFSRANLTEAVFREANLQGADLIGATLVDADLTGAKLTGADLRGAVLRRAVLTGADLSGTNLSEVFSLTKEEFSKALIDSNTIPPSEFARTFIPEAGE